jgi:hypothetical protein
MILEKTLDNDKFYIMEEIRKQIPEIDVDLYTSTFNPIAGDDVEELLGQGVDLDTLYTVGLLDDEPVPRLGITSPKSTGCQPMTDEDRKLLQQIIDNPDDYPLPF